MTEPTDSLATWAEPSPETVSEDPAASRSMLDDDPEATFAPPPPPPSQPLGSRPPAGVPRGLVAVLAPVLAVVMFASGLVVAHVGDPGAVGNAGPSASPQASSADAELALIEEAWQDLQDNYVDAKSLDNQALAYAAIKAMTDAIGDSGHTMFMTAAESKAMDQSLSGTFVGIGVQVASGDGSTGVTVGFVIPNTPAEQAGLRHGDRIVAVDGTTTIGATVDATVARIRGPEGQPVKLTIVRAGVPQFDVTIVRRKFDLPLSSWSMIPGRKIAYIRLDQFASGAGKAVVSAITAAKAAGATAIILDLRGNPGGYVNEAITVASQFVGSGAVYQSIDRSGTTVSNSVEPGGLWTDQPLVVLANGDTASAAEIVTGAIQDAGRAKVVGEKTFGTGTVLGRFDLADGSTLRIGIERWLTRAGRPIWHEGLVPDVTVALPTSGVELAPNDLQGMTPADLAKSTDAQLLKALDLLVGQG